MENKEEKLLHISDTPSTIYGGLRELIKNIKPSYIVHTGDMVDNYKIGIYPFLIEEYGKRVKELIDIIERENTKENILMLGNHDSKEIVEKYSKKSIVKDKGYKTKISGVTFSMGHFLKDVLEDPGEYNLFGHDLSKVATDDNRVYLNGISSINIIALESGKVFSLKYPWGTNDARLLKSRTKI